MNCITVDGGVTFWQVLAADLGALLIYSSAGILTAAALIKYRARINAWLSGQH